MQNDVDSKKGRTVRLVVVRCTICCGLGSRLKKGEQLDWWWSMYDMPSLWPVVVGDGVEGSTIHETAKLKWLLMRARRGNCTTVVLVLRTNVLLVPGLLHVVHLTVISSPLFEFV